MAILKLYTYPDKILRQKCEPVAAVTDDIRRLMDDMLETMYADKGVGLAAPQVGIAKRIIVVDDKVSEDGEPGPNPRFLVNPEIIRKSEDTIWFNERNMPHSFFEIEHSTDIQNSLLKFNDLQDFYVRMAIVADIKRKPEFEAKMRFHASPWSPPACFKDNHSMLGGGRLIPTDRNYAAYAAYLADYVQAMAAEGVNIERLMPQNEPDAATRYPSCLMNVDEMARLVADYLVPEFEKRALSTEIWAGTFRTITGLHALDALDNAALHGNIHGIGIQYSVKDLLWEVVRKYPDIPVMHTESACYNGQNTMEQSIILFDDIIDSFNIGCRVYTYWNTILPENGLSSWGWKQNSLVSVMDNGEIRYNPDFNIIKLWSQSLGCRARRISSLCLKRKHFAAILPDGKIPRLPSLAARSRIRFYRRSILRRSILQREENICFSCSCGYYSVNVSENEYGAAFSDDPRPYSGVPDMRKTILAPWSRSEWVR